MVFNLTENKKKSIKLINIPIEELTLEITMKASEYFGTTITDIVTQYGDGNIVITDNEKVFAEFLLQEWSSSKGFSQSKPSEITAYLWLDFVFIQDTQNVMRLFENGKIYYIYYNR